MTEITTYTSVETDLRFMFCRCLYVVSLNQAYWRIAIYFVFIFQRSFDCGRYCD